MAIGKQSRSQVAKVRKVVFERDNATCVLAHTELFGSCTDELTIQHRVARGMGSSRLFDAPNYLLSMCAYHNWLDVADADFHLYCINQGYSIPRWVLNTNQINRIPVWYPDGWHILDGVKRLWIAESVAQDFMNDIYGDDSVG